MFLQLFTHTFKSRPRPHTAYSVWGRGLKGLLPSLIPALDPAWVWVWVFWKETCSGVSSLTKVPLLSPPIQQSHRQGRPDHIPSVGSPPRAPAVISPGESALLGIRFARWHWFMSVFMSLGVRHKRVLFLPISAFIPTLSNPHFLFTT